MNRITFNKLNIKQQDTIKTIKYNDCTIEVLQSLPTRDINDFIYAVLAKSEQDDGTYNEVLLNAYFHLYLIYLYTNITFTQKQKEDELKLYDLINNSGLLDAVLSVFPEEEYNDLLDYLNKTREEKSTYKRSVAGVLDKVINDMPKNAEAAAKIVDNFDQEKYQNVLKLAKATGMR